MADETSTPGPGGQQPEALNTFKAAARTGSVKPEDQGMTAKADTAPKPKDPSEKHEAAAEVLKAGAEGHPETKAAAKEASER